MAIQYLKYGGLEPKERRHLNPWRHIGKETLPGRNMSVEGR